MNIVVVGTGYVGLTSGASFAELGNNIVCVDVNKDKIDNLNQGIIPIYEPGLKELIKRNVDNGRLSFTTNLPQALEKSEVVLIAVGTPSLSDGSVDMTYIKQVAKEIGRHINKSIVIVNKSTVPVGTADLVENIVLEHLSDRSISVEVASVPEFLKEGSAIHDIFHGDRIIIGAPSKRVTNMLIKLHEPFNIPIQITDVRSAELIKYAANSFLAMKISFINEIANIADQVGADVTEVAKGIGSDSRIGEKFLKAGIGFGGACFPKDTRGLIKMAEKAGHSFKLLEEVIRINDKQYEVVLKKLEGVYPDLNGKTIAILGLAFKPNTDDIRDAPSLSIIHALKTKYPNLTIKAYDPIVKNIDINIVKHVVDYCNSIEDAIEAADAAIIVTEWDEIVDFNVANYSEYMNSAVIIDGRNCLDISRLLDHEIDFYAIGRPSRNLEKTFTYRNH